MKLDLLIRGGRVTDGQGGPLAPADVGICGDTVLAIGPGLERGDAQVLDAAGAVVSPGFIDIHTHGDVVPLMCPEAPGRLHDGVTLEIVGNCGESPFPQSGAMLHERRDSEQRYGVAVDWQTLDDFARRQDAAGSGINRGSLVGHSNVRIAVMGEEDRPATDSELAAMRRLVAEAMDAGAFGMSTGLIYTPGMYAPAWEIRALAEEVAARGGFYASHIRNESDAVEEAIEEFADVGRQTGVRLQLSHVKVSGRDNWPRAGAVVALLKRLRAEGLDLACDRYPYVAGCTGLTALLPGWAREGGREQLLQRLADPTDRERMRQAMAANRSLDADWEAVRISSAHSEAHADAEGCSILDLARETGHDPADVVFELLLASRGRTSILVFSMREENLERFLRLPYVAVASDSTARAADGPTAYGRPHPRTYGTASRFLGRYVRDRGLMSLPEGVRRLTGLPASRLGLTRRGVLRAGAAADITVFDPDAITDRATFDEPKQYSVGVRHVVVNGAVALKDGELTGVRAGRFLRRASP